MRMAMKNSRRRWRPHRVSSRAGTTRKGNCERGDACRFSHGPVAPGLKPKAKAKAKAKATALSKEELERRKQTPCLNFTKPGGCKFGEKCQFLHQQKVPETPTIAAVATEIAAPIVDAEMKDIFGSSDEESTDVGKSSAVSSQDVASPATPPPPLVRHHVRAWAADTGSGNHLVGRRQIDNRDIDIKMPLSKPKKLQTANGIIMVNDCTRLHSDALGEDIEVIELQSTADVVSVGRLCMERGYTFEWLPYALPKLVRPDGYQIRMYLDHFVPMIVESTHSDEGDALPAVVKDHTDTAPIVMPAPDTPPGDQPASPGTPDSHQPDQPAHDDHGDDDADRGHEPIRGHCCLR